MIGYSNEKPEDEKYHANSAKIISSMGEKTPKLLDQFGNEKEILPKKQPIGFIMVKNTTTIEDKVNDKDN